MADPMTQSHQISSSQGLNDGHTKDSKFSDSFFPSSPVSLIQSPQDKRVALDSDKPSEGVATSLRFSSQPSSFSPATYENESPVTLGGSKNRSFQEKLELFESSPASQKQDSSPIKVSPVSERIKALEALAAKQNVSDWTDGGFPHFKERHYDKSPTEGHGISYRSSVKKKPTPTEQDSPESPFEILGEARRGSEFEDTADWMRAHLPPAPNFNLDEADIDEVKQPCVMQESPCKETKSKATEAPAIPESFVGVPDEFMDTPTEVTSQINDTVQPKQDSIEDESEFDLRFLPTAYMWDKQEKADMDAQEPPGLSEIHEEATPPAPPAGFESSPLASPTPIAEADSSTNQQTGTLGCGKEPAEILEVDSSGESDDTVIEDGNDLSHAASSDSIESKPSTNNGTFSHEQVKPVIQVPIINVIETEEQVLSDYEVEHEEEMEYAEDKEEEDDDDDEQKYRIKQEPTREDSQSSDEPSEVLKSMSEEPSPTTEDISSQAVIIDSDSTEDKLIKDSASEYTINEISLERPGTEDPSQSALCSNAVETFIEYAVNAIETEETAEIMLDLPPNYDDLSNEVESSDIDTYLDHYSTEEQAILDQLNSDVFTEIESEADELLIPDTHQHSLNNTIFSQQSCKESVVDEVDESLQESNVISNYNALTESSAATESADVHVEHETSRNKLESLEDEDQMVVVEDQKAVPASISITLAEEEDQSVQPEAILSSTQESTFALFPSFHNDLSSEITEEITDLDVTNGVVETNTEQGEAVQCDASDRKESPELPSQPETTETETPAQEATDSFVEFMRECLKSQQNVESMCPGHTRKEHVSVTPSSPAVVMNLVQDECIAISALKELGNSREDDNETNICDKNISVSSKDEASKSESIYSLPTAQSLQNEYQSDASLSREVEAIDLWVAEAYHLAEHVLALILTHLSVHDLVYWRDPKKSGIVFGTSLLLLLSLAAFSVISVVSYLLLALLCVTISFRVYKSVMQAVQKTNEGHPFKELMEKDVSLPPETFRKHVDVCLSYINCGLKQLSRLFLVEDLVDSLKLAVVMWLLTYVGAVFNGITILILVDILAFTVPPLYEKYKTQIDHYVGIARTHLKNVVTKIQEKLPKAAKRNKTE